MRWADLDLQGHVNNVAHADYLQEARTDLLRRHAPPVGADASAAGLVVVRHRLAYLEPIPFRSGPVGVECWVSEIRAASFTLGYELFHDDGVRRVYGRATSVLTPYQFDEGRPRRLRPEERASLEPFVEAPPDLREPAPRGDGPVPRDQRAHYPVVVRFSDLDIYAHVNNVTYLAYFMEARIRYTDALLRDVPRETPQLSMVVANTDVDYLAPMLLGPQAYDAWTRLVRLSERSMVLETEICDGDRVVARAMVTMVFVDPETGRATTPNPDHRAALETGWSGQELLADGPAAE